MQTIARLPAAEGYQSLRLAVAHRVRVFLPTVFSVTCRAGFRGAFFEPRELDVVVEESKVRREALGVRARAEVWGVVSTHCSTINNSREYSKPGQGLAHVRAEA